MARGNETAQSSAKFGLDTARSGYGALMPELQGDVRNPQGFAAPDLARMNTAVQESAGGSNAGAIGQGALLTGRTKNPGAASAAIAESTRRSGEEAQKNALGIKIRDAELKQNKRQSALQGLGAVSGTALGAVAPGVQADNAAKEASWGWAKHILSPLLGAAGGAAGSYYGAR